MGKKRRAHKSSQAISSRRASWSVGAGIIVLLLSAVLWKTLSTSNAIASPAAQPSTLYDKPNFLPTIPNTTPEPAHTPDGMAWIPGGEFSMGAQDAPEMNDVAMHATADSRPIHRVKVDAFWMDKTDVTNAELAKFVAATKYVTVAERKPRPEDFPGAPPENLVPGSVVFSPRDHEVSLNDHFQWWSYIHGANWRHPQGPASDIKGKEKYPVVHIAYEDAAAYAKWAGTGDRAAVILPVYWFRHILSRPGGIRAVADRNPFAPDARRSIVVSSDEAFGLARMYVSYTEIPDSRIRIYRSLIPALEWVGLDAATKCQAQTPHAIFDLS